MIEGIKRIQSRISEIETNFKKMGINRVDSDNPNSSFANMLNDAIGKTSNSTVQAKAVDNSDSLEILTEALNHLTNKNLDKNNNFDLYKFQNYTVDMIRDDKKLEAKNNAYVDNAIERYRRAAGKFPTAYDNMIKQAAEEYNVPEQLIKAVIKQESNYSPDAVSPKGAVGLMQIMPDTATELGIETDNLTDPYTNIMGGTKYLSEMLDRYSGRLDLSLSAYNAGPNLVDRVQRIPNIDETKNYVSNIINYLK